MLKVLWRGWLFVARKIGYVQSMLVMSVMYFVAIAPFALGIRLFSDPLRLRGAPSWHPFASDRQRSSGLDFARRQF